MCKQAITILAALLLLAGCDSAGPAPKPDLKLEYNGGTVQADLTGGCSNCVRQWREHIGASAEVSGTEVGGQRFGYDVSVRVHYRIIREAEHEAGPDTLRRVNRANKVRRGDGTIYGSAEELTDLSDEYIMPDSVVFVVRMEDQTERVVGTEFEDTRGGNGSLD